MSENEHILAGPVQKTGDFTNGGRAVPGRSAVFSAAGRGDPSGNSNGVPLG
ncbi:MAG: hypothetical protein HZA50_08515 [Planctomycetes bacterium]|nr:hypothetical protein [Planctomycetota bacterium]